MRIKNFELDPRRPLQTTIRQVAENELLGASRVLLEQPKGLEEAVHDFRKSMKKTRALLRLVRHDMGEEYAQCNENLRDASRLLSLARDREALIESLDLLSREAKSEREEAVLKELEGVLRRRKSQELSSAQLSESMDRANRLVEDTLKLLRKVHVESPKTLTKGLKKTYGRARRRYEAALSRGDEELHELRKRVKYHRYHLRLLRPNFRRVLNAERKVAKTVSDLLGDDHDLAVLREQVPDLHFSEEQRNELTPLIERKRADLQSRALRLCDLLLAETPKRKSQRVSSYVKKTTHHRGRTS